MMSETAVSARALLICGAQTARDLKKKFGVEYSDLRDVVPCEDVWRPLMEMAYGTLDPEQCSCEEAVALFKGMCEKGRDTLKRYVSSIGGPPPPVPKFVKEEILRIIKPHAEREVRKNLLFVVKYDTSLDFDDLNNELALEIHKALTNYEHRRPPEIFSDTKIVKKGTTEIPLRRYPVVEVLGVTVNGKPTPHSIRSHTVIIPEVTSDTATVDVEYVHYLRLFNAVKYCVDNKIKNLTKENSRKQRARLVKTSDGFRTSTETLTDTHNIAVDPDMSLDDYEVTAALTETLTDVHRELVQIVIGNPSEGFEVWLKEAHGKDFDTLTLTHRGSLGMEYTGVDPDDAACAIRDAMEQVSPKIEGLKTRGEIKEELDKILQLDDGWKELARLEDDEIEEWRKDIRYCARKQGFHPCSINVMISMFNGRINSARGAWKKYIKYQAKKLDMSVVPGYRAVRSFLLKAEIRRYLPDRD